MSWHTHTYTHTARSLELCVVLGACHESWLPLGGAVEVFREAVEAAVRGAVALAGLGCGELPTAVHTAGVQPAAALP